MNTTYWNQDQKTFSKPFVPYWFLYRDYQMIWFNVIWYKLRAFMVHSILPECSQNPLTILVYKMVDIFGSAKDIFSVPILELFHYFIQNISKTFSIDYAFRVYFQIPWILTWNFQIKESEISKTGLQSNQNQMVGYIHLYPRKFQSSEGLVIENGHLQDLSKKKTTEFLN